MHLINNFTNQKITETSGVHIQAGLIRVVLSDFFRIKGQPFFPDNYCETNETLFKDHLKSGIFIVNQGMLYHIGK